MATRLGGPVEVEVTLNTKKAEQQINQLESKLKDSKAKATQVNKVAGIEKLTSAAGPARGVGTGAEARAKTTKSATERLLDAVKKTGITRQTFMTAPPPEAATSIGGAVRGVASAVAPAVAGYAAVSTAAQASPFAIEALKAALPTALTDNPVFKGLSDSVLAIRESIATLESGVKALYTATTKTADVAAAGMRLTGEVPNIAYYWDQNHKAESQEERLRKTFNRFKMQEVGEAVGRSVAEMTKGFQNR